MKNIKDYTLEELKEQLVQMGEKPFRAEQIFAWLYVEKVKEFVMSFCREKNQFSFLKE